MSSCRASIAPRRLTSTSRTRAKASGAMPDEDGYAFIRRVREMEGGEHRPHVVALALTSFARVEDRIRALKAGFDAHVSKPIDPERVLRTLVQALGAGAKP